MQVCDVAKGGNPTTYARVRHGDDWDATNGESARVTSRGTVAIRECLLPQSDDAGGAELDMGEEVSSRPWDPRLGDDTTRFECGQFVV